MEIATSHLIKIFPVFLKFFSHCVVYEVPLWWEVISQFTDHNVKFVVRMGGGAEAKHGAARINKGPLH